MARAAEPAAVQGGPPVGRDDHGEHDAARSRLIEAARESFAEKGFHGTTTRDIAAAAHMSPAAVYVHHRTKESLLFEISRQGHEAILRVVREALEGVVDPTEQLHALARAFARRHAAAHTTARVVNYELAALSQEHRAVVEELRHQIEDEVRTVLRAGIAAGQFDCPNVHLTTSAILGLGVDIARWYRDDLRWSPDEIADHQAQMALRMVNARG